MNVVMDGKTRAQEVGERIVLARQELGIKQVELAQLLGIGERSMQAYEAGETLPWKRLRDLEKHLKRPISWFLHGDDAMISRDEQLDEVKAAIERVGEINARRDAILVDLLETTREILQVLKGS